MFSKEYCFKYSDLDNKGNIKISTIVELLQDISILHSAEVGYNVSKMQEIDLAMLLRGWEIKIFETFSYEKPVLFKTGIIKVKRCDVIRKYEIVQDGIVKGIATAGWFSFSTDKKTIIRVPEEINSAYDTISEEDNGLSLSKLRPCLDAVKISETKVTRRDLDTNNHMNNVKSVEVCLDYVPEEKEIQELSVVYIKELKKDEIIEVFVKDDEEEFFVELRNSEGITCVMVKIA